jgi:hypothetical protein
MSVTMPSMQSTPLPNGAARSSFGRRLVQPSNCTMASFQSPLAKHLNKGASSETSKTDQPVPFWSGPLSASSDARRPAPGKAAFAASPALLLRSKLSPQPSMLATQAKHPQASHKGPAGRGVSPIPPATTLDDELSQLTLGRPGQGSQARLAMLVSEI